MDKNQVFPDPISLPDKESREHRVTETWYDPKSAGKTIFHQECPTSILISLFLCLFLEKNGVIEMDLVQPDALFVAALCSLGLE